MPLPRSTGERGYEFAPERARFSWIKTKAEIYNKQGRYDVALRLIDSSRMMCPTHPTSPHGRCGRSTPRKLRGTGQAKKARSLLPILILGSPQGFARRQHTQRRCAPHPRIVAVRAPQSPEHRPRGAETVPRTPRIPDDAGLRRDTAARGHGWGCAYGTGQKLREISPAKNAS